MSPGSASMVHLHSPLLPRPPAPPPPPVPGESPLGKSKLEMSPLEPLRVPPHVSSAVSHQREKPGGEGKGAANTHCWLFQSHYKKLTIGNIQWLQAENIRTCHFIWGGGKKKEEIWKTIADSAVCDRIFIGKETVFHQTVK